MADDSDEDEEELERLDKIKPLPKKGPLPGRRGERRRSGDHKKRTGEGPRRQPTDNAPRSRTTSLGQGGGSPSPKAHEAVEAIVRVCTGDGALGAKELEALDRASSYLCARRSEIPPRSSPT